MIYIICYWVSILVFIGGIVFTLVSRRKARVVRFKSLNMLIVSVFVSATALFIPIYSRIFQGDSLSWIKTILISMHNAIRLFIVDGEFDIINDNITGTVIGIATPYSILAAVVFILAPVLTFSVVLSLIKNAYAYIAYLFSYFRDVYVFSELNDESIALAKSIRSNHPKARIIYTDVFESNDERSYELVQKARSLVCVFFKNDMEYIHYGAHGKNSYITFFAIGRDESENIRQAITLVDRFRDRDKTSLYVFSSKCEGELLLADLDKGKVKVRRINESRSMINRYLYENGEVVFDNAIHRHSGKKDIRILIAGLGTYGKEMLKTMTWFCQMDGYRVFIDAFDRDKYIKNVLLAECPELLSKEYNGCFDKGDKGDAEYKITIHSGIDVYTNTFNKEVSKLDDITYIFVALGNDSENVKAATRLRMLMEQRDSHPYIAAVVKDSHVNRGLQNIHNFKGQRYDIHFIGALDKMYSENAIIGSDLENEALKSHLKWGKEDEFWDYEYNYQSSVATTIHTKMKKYCGIKGSGKKNEELTEDERNTLEQLAHRRWNAYMRSEGYIYSGSPAASSRNDLGKMHHNLMPYKMLSEKDKRKDSKVASE